MKISYNWLKQFINLENISPKKLAHDLSLFGHEVESIKKIENDYILDLEITPNRGDCLSILGIARELSALYERKINIPEVKLTENSQKTPKVSIESKDICSLFAARIIENITIKQSPNWIKKRLQSYGFRPLNNIIDITNYIMIETGQPLHAFDYDKISNGVVNIRSAKPNESIITLDGKNNILSKDAIVINDDKKIYDLAGIMGGYSSEVDSNTKNILLQGSILNPVMIRRTSKKLSKITDASYRFERGVDQSNTIYSVNRATCVIKRLCPKSKISKLSITEKEKSQKVKIKINPEKINRLLGTKMSKDDIKEYLHRLNYKYTNDTVEVPTYRSFDTTIWQDIAEELARIYGYNNLGTTSLKKEEIVLNKSYAKKESLKDFLVDSGFTEIKSYTFANEKLIKLLNHNIKNCPKVINPVAPENKYLRPSLDVSILEAISKNPWAPEINIFEIGKVFDKDSEKWQLAIATTEKKAKNIKNVIKSLQINSKINNIEKKVADFLKIRKNVNYIICDLKNIKYNKTDFRLTVSNEKYRNISNFAPTIRDLAFIVNKNLDTNEIQKEIIKSDNKIFLVELFDEFASDKFGKNKKNVAYHIWMQELDRPMSSEKSDIIIKKIIKNINNKFKARLR